MKVFGSVRSRLNAALVSLSLMVMGAAIAGPTPTYDTTSLNAQLVADIDNAAGMGFDLLVIVVGAVVGLALIKKFVFRAT